MYEALGTQLEQNKHPLTHGGHLLVPPPPSVESEPPFIVTVVSSGNNLTVLRSYYSCPIMSYLVFP